LNIQITTLSEDTGNYGFLAEWGLSILVEVDGLRVLLDTGYSFSAVHNAQILGIDLGTIDYIVLSHGHADHTGGLRNVLKIKRGVDVIAHPDLWSAKYVLRGNQPLRYAGIPFKQEELESLGARFKYAEEPFNISENIMTTGEITMTTEYENIESSLLIKKENELIPDFMSDDSALIINTDYGLVIILGCAHRGIINTIRHAQNITGNQKVHTVIGGTHLYPASEERVEKTIVDLKKIGIENLGVSHCTGFHASARLSQEFRDIFFLNHAGTRIILS
jgi:7,8-dihydropterin-6-yl-methyl-4-(beta-D-ribofuranosyl)aminobenzene 5'-phosphate synthase